MRVQCGGAIAARLSSGRRLNGALLLSCAAVALPVQDGGGRADQVAAIHLAATALA